jgi:hypothetical protein
MSSLPPVLRPVTDTPQVRELCRHLVPGAIPQLVRVDPPPWAKPNECTENVARVIAEHGGAPTYGWQLWENLPGVMIEAEFHAVWIVDEEPPLDVTPKLVPGIDHSVFLADADLIYEGKQINNERVALVDDPLVEDLIRAFDEDFEVMNRGPLANFHGEFIATPEMDQIKQRIDNLLVAVTRKYF